LDTMFPEFDKPQNNSASRNEIIKKLKQLQKK
jgi:hypothetical protein